MLNFKQSKISVAIRDRKDELQLNLSNLSPSFKLNEKDLAFGGTASDFQKVFNHWQSTTNYKNLTEEAGSEIKLNKILKGFIFKIYFYINMIFYNQIYKTLFKFILININDN